MHGKNSSAQPAGHRLPGIGVVANDAKSGSDGDGKNEPHAAPDPAPKKQGNGDGDGIKLHLAPDELRSDEVLGDHVNAGQHEGDDAEMTHGFLLQDRQKETGQPGQDRAKVGDHVENAGSDPGHDRVIKAKSQEENAAASDDHQRDHAHANKIVAENNTQVV